MSKSTTGGQKNFARAPSVSIQRSTFDRSCGIKTTFDAGWLMPIFMDEALPGDTMNLKATLFGRLATPIHPYMDNLYLDTHFFAVPLRLIWDNFQKFMGEQTNPGDSTDYLVPKLTTPAGGHPELSMADFMGIPTKVDNLDPSVLWHRAYNLIWNEWFRDENLQDAVVENKGDGPDDEDDYVLLKRGKRHDYFTSFLPFPQKGPSVSLPIGESAPVMADTSGLAPTFLINSLTPTLGTGGTVNGVVFSDTIGTNEGPALWDNPRLMADLTGATAATVNEIRQGFQIQRLYEKDARGGSRYIETVFSHFGVSSPDARLQRPEFLGGSSSPINIQQVAQTSNTNELQGENNIKGDLAAFGTVVAGKGHGFVKSFTEHCIILGFASVRGDLNYQQGLNRMFSRSTRWDFFWPSLSGLGEQTVHNREIYAQGTDDDDLAFGFQERFAEYRYKPSIVTGSMRSNSSATTDTWHLAQDFGELPVLNDAFIQEDPPIDRIIAVPSEAHLVMDGFFQFKCARPIPMYGVPGNIDRF